MKTGFTHYYFLISCPSDVESDINIIFEVVSDVNQRIGEPNYIHIVPLFWKRDAIPSVGNSAQNIINQQLLEEADGVIALFWTKFGTPTDAYGSGTEGEIIKAIEDNKDVVLLCSEKQISPKQIDFEQYRKVEEFKETYHGLFASYSTEIDLKEQLRRILTSLVFKYSKQGKGIRNDVNIIPNGSIEYSLAEYFELGWFLRRSYIEVPLDATSSIQEKSSFRDRISVLLALVNYYKFLKDEDFQVLVTYENVVQTIGLKGYIEECGKEGFEKVQQILDICELSLTRKLVQKQSAAFQMGMFYGQYVLSIQMQWLGEGGINTLKDINQKKKDELQLAFQQIYSFSRHIDVDFSENIKNRWIKCHENENMTLDVYNERINSLAEEILHELQLYS